MPKSKFNQNKYTALRNQLETLCSDNNDGLTELAVLKDMLADRLTCSFRPKAEADWLKYSNLMENQVYNFVSNMLTIAETVSPPPKKVKKA